MRTDRLLTTAKNLRKLKREEFNFAEFVSEEKSGECGTVCCVIGWMPRFDPEEWKWWSRANYACEPPFLHPFHKSGSAGIAGAMEYFELAEHEALRLFHPRFAHLGDNPTPKKVAKHIEEFVESWRGISE